MLVIVVRSIVAEGHWTTIPSRDRARGRRCSGVKGRDPCCQLTALWLAAHSLQLWPQRAALFLICRVGIVALAPPNTSDVQGDAMRSILGKALQTMG